MKKIVIVGGVAAGPKAATRVKRLDPGAEVTVVDQDSLISYGGCGIPYFVSGDVADEKELRSTSFHMLRDERFFDKTKGVKTLTSTKAISINRKEKSVLVENLLTGERQNLEYDSLLLATGSKPGVLPIPGNDAPNVFTVNNIHKAVAIKEKIARGEVGKAVVIGGGAIGIEMSEALSDLWGVETSLVEFQKQLLPGILDWTLATIAEKELRDNGVSVYTGEGAVEIECDDRGEAVAVRTPKRRLDADMVIMATGIHPASELAGEAGLAVTEAGAILVNNRLQTTDPDIFAAGDCVAIPHLVTGRPFVAPFGSMANREGRVAGDNMAGIPSTFPGSVGSFILKVYNIAAGSVGLSLSAAKAEGFDADFSLSSPSDRAHFYPGQDIICLQLIFDRKSRKVLGLQGTGPANDGLSVRLDAAAVAIANGATVDDFGNIEMVYSPPFSPAIDPINAAGYVADNLCSGRMRQLSMEEFFEWMDKPELHPDWCVLDVRHPKQASPYLEKFGENMWMSLPYDEVRERWQELPDDRYLVIFCNAGSRSYEIQVFLDYVGKKNNIVLPGGFNVLRRMGPDWLPVK